MSPHLWPLIHSPPVSLSLTAMGSLFIRSATHFLTARLQHLAALAIWTSIQIFLSVAWVVWVIIAVLFSNSLTDDGLKIERSSSRSQHIGKRTDQMISCNHGPCNLLFMHSPSHVSIHSCVIQSMIMMMIALGKCVFAASKGIVVCLIWQCVHRGRERELDGQ